MIWKSDQGSRGYHHGNLKEALIRAALELIAAKGPSGFTFAEAARSAGVSPAAEGNIPLEVSQGLRDAGESAFAVIRSTAERLVAQIPAAQRPPAFMVALHVWSLAHGIASLFGRGDAGRRRLPMQPEELLEAGVLVYLRGLGFPEGAVAAT